MKQCKKCKATLTGPGSNNAVLCLDCWAEVLIRAEGGTPMTRLANEYGVSRQAVQQKVMMYGEDQ